MRVAQRFSAGKESSDGTESAKRTTEERSSCLCFSAVREADCEFTCSCPSAKALGYCHSVRFADVAKIDSCRKASEEEAEAYFFRRGLDFFGCGLDFFACRLDFLVSNLAFLLLNLTFLRGKTRFQRIKPLGLAVSSSCGGRLQQPNVSGKEGGLAVEDGLKRVESGQFSGAYARRGVRSWRIHQHQVPNVG
jgi:hypothetical protein